MEQMLQVENGSFTPLVFSVNTAVGKEASKCYGRIATNLTEERNETYLVTVAWLRSKILLPLMQSIIICVTGSPQ